jgi:hypothetical protein
MKIFYLEQSVEFYKNVSLTNNPHGSYKLRLLMENIGTFEGPTLFKLLSH